MSALAEFQDRFQRAVKDGDDAIFDEILDTSKENRHTLLGVYRNAYVLRLIGILEHDYEKLHSFLGDEQFAVLAREYIAAHPSHTPNARWFGAQLPELLASGEHFENADALADLAALERALNDTFDARDADILTMDHLATIPPEVWPSLSFEPHPAVQRLEHRTNASDIWKALKNEKPSPMPESLAEPRMIVVYRPQGTATFREMSVDEAMMWNEAVRGVRFSVLCEILSMYAGEDEAPVRAAGYLKRWIDSEMLSGMRSGEE